MIININKKLFLKILIILVLIISGLYIIKYLFQRRYVLVNNNYNQKYISFTYDDGPSKYTGEIIDILEKNNSSATFFVIGEKICDNKETILKIYNSNSEIGSHTFNHIDLSKMNNKEIKDNLDKTNRIFNSVTNDNLKLLRPPYEKYNKNILDFDYNIITWNIDTRDWKTKNRNKIYNNIIKNACDGCIVLMHDTIKETKFATEMAIKTLQIQGYSIVSISKLMEIKKYDITKKEVISSIK